MSNFKTQEREYYINPEKKIENFIKIEYFCIKNFYSKIKFQNL